MPTSLSTKQASFLHVASEDHKTETTEAVFNKLCDLVRANPDLLVAYKDDLNVIDRQHLAASMEGEEYIWVLRKHGTELFPIASGYDPINVTFWLQDGACAFWVRITAKGGSNGTVMPITFEKARNLASLPMPVGKRGWVPRGFALIFKAGDQDLGRISNVSGIGFDAFVGSESTRDAWLGRFEIAQLAKDAVEKAAIIKIAA